jgi:hypothetical protein
MSNRRVTAWIVAALFALGATPARAHHTIFDYRVDRFEADGNAFGPFDGVADFVDEFDDGTLTWGVVSGTASESGGMLHLTNPGTHYGPYDLSEAANGTTIADGAGDFTVTSFWDGAPKTGDFTHMTLFLPGDAPAGAGWEFFGILLQQTADQGLQIVQHHGYGSTASEVESTPLDSTAIVGPIVLRIAFDDATNLATTAWSLDGGLHFTSGFSPLAIFNGPTSGFVLLGADPLAAGDGPGRCGNFVIEGDEQCDMGAHYNDGTCCTATCRLVDADGDGVCDPIDNCLWRANPTQDDSDGDGIGNACDACVLPGPAQRAWSHPLVALYHLNDRGEGDEKLVLRGTFPLGPGAGAVDPMATGAHVQVRSLHGEPPIDLVAPPGTGWRASRGRFTFTDRQGRYTGSIQKMVVQSRRDGSVAVTALAPRGAFNFGAAALPPLQAGVSLGDTTQACAEVVFPLWRCKSPGSRRIICR